MTEDPEISWGSWKLQVSDLLLEHGYSQFMIATMDWSAGWRDLWRDGCSASDAVVDSADGNE